MKTICIRNGHSRYHGHMTIGTYIIGPNRIEQCQNRSNGHTVKMESVSFQRIPVKQPSQKNCTTNTNTICTHQNRYQYDVVYQTIDSQNVADYLIPNACQTPVWLLSCTMKRGQQFWEVFGFFNQTIFNDFHFGNLNFSYMESHRSFTSRTVAWDYRRWRCEHMESPETTVGRLCWNITGSCANSANN